MLKKYIILLVLITFYLAHDLPAQSGLKFGVKIKPGNAVESFPDNKYTAIASGKNIAMVNNVSGVVSKTFQGHLSSISDLDISEDGSLLLSTSNDKSVIIWDVKSGAKKQQFRGHRKPVLKGAFISSTKVASISSGNILKIWDIDTGNELHTFSDHTKKVYSLAATGKYIATGGSGGKIVIRNSVSGEIINQISASSDIIRSLTFDIKGEQLISGSDDGFIKIWNPENGELIGELSVRIGKIRNISMAFDNKHIAVSGQSCNIYDLSTLELIKKIDKVSSVVLDASLSPDGQSLFFLEEFSPKARIWDVSDLNIAYVVKLKDGADKTPPQIFVSSPAKIIDNRVVHYQDFIAIRGSIIDDYGVRQLKVNGVNTPVRQNGNFVINLPLAMGDNYVTMEVTDINDNTSLKKFIINRKNMDGEEYDPSEAKNYLLVIGINKYEHWPQLYNAVKDANDVVNTLLSLYNFEFSDITLITDETATRSNIYKTLREFVNLVGPKDNLLIYYSGHGYFDELLNEGYWVPIDAKLNSTGDYLSNSDISKIIANINSQHTFLVADACFSGSLFSVQNRGYADNVEKYKSRWALASGRLEAVSDGEIGTNSPFTRAFINYLKENEKSKVAVSELVQYVKMQVAEVSDQTPIGNPLRGVGDEGGEYIFYKKEQ